MGEFIGVVLIIAAAIGLWVLGVFMVLWNGNIMIDHQQLYFWPLVTALLGLAITTSPFSLLGAAASSN